MSRPRLVLALLVLILGVAAGRVDAADAPRGKRTARPVATYVTVTETALTTGGGAATLMAGVPVVARGSGALHGKVKVTVAMPVQVDGTVDGDTLGLCVVADTPLVADAGGATLGVARPGALVRVLASKGAELVVETVTPVQLRVRMPRAVLAARRVDVVIDREWSVSTQKPADLYVDARLGGTPFTRVPSGVKLELVEQNADFAHVRTVGGVVVEGWTSSSFLAPRSSPPATPPEPQLIKPTHEVFVDAPIFADPAAKRRIGTMRGGALVEGSAKSIDPHFGDPVAIKTGTVKVTSPAPAIVEGWMRLADLRELGVEGVK